MGRLMADTIINCGNEKDEIVQAMKKAAATEHKKSALYGDGHTSEIITETIKKLFSEEKIDLKKHFYTI